MEIFFFMLHSLRSNCLFHQLSVKSTLIAGSCASAVVWVSILWGRRGIFRVLLPNVVALPNSLLFLAEQFDCQVSLGLYFFLIRIFKRETLDSSPEQFSVTLVISALWSFCAHVSKSRLRERSVNLFSTLPVQHFGVIHVLCVCVCTIVKLCVCIHVPVCVYKWICI